MKNITLAIDEAVLAKVRHYAAANNTSVNALVREALERIAARDESHRQAWETLFRLADASEAEVGPITWTRDDVHER